MIIRRFHTCLTSLNKKTPNWWKNEEYLDYFEKHGLDRHAILQYKKHFHKNVLFVKQHVEFMKEAGVLITVPHLINLRSIAKTDIQVLYNENKITDTNITERFLKHLPPFDYQQDLPMPSAASIAEIYKKHVQYHRRQFAVKTETSWPRDIPLETENTLRTIQKSILRQFFAKYFSCDYLTIDKLMFSYLEESYIRSCGSVVTNLEIYEKQLEFPRQMILRHFYLVNTLPERLEEIIKNVDKIGTVDLKTAVVSTPKILAKSCDDILDVENTLKEYGIDTTSPYRVFILSLTASTLKSRLKTISEGQLKPFLVHPRICEIIFYFNKACKRLKEIEQRGMKCISLNILTANQKIFERYLAEGVDRTRSCQDVIYYLANILNSDRKTVYSIFKRHPLRFFVPFAEVIATTKALLDRGIPKDVILECVTIVLYPREKVLKVLDKVESDEELKNFGMAGGFANSDSMFQAGSRCKDRRMILCLYYLEAPFHFTGDGAMRTPETPQLGSNSETSATLS